MGAAKPECSIAELREIEREEGRKKEKIFPGFQPGRSDFRSQLKCNFKSYELSISPLFPSKPSRGGFNPCPFSAGRSLAVYSFIPRETMTHYPYRPGGRFMNVVWVNGLLGVMPSHTLLARAGTDGWVNAHLQVCLGALTWSFTQPPGDRVREATPVSYTCF